MGSAEVGGHWRPWRPRPVRSHLGSCGGQNDAEFCARSPKKLSTDINTGCFSGKECRPHSCEEARFPRPSHSGTFCELRGTLTSGVVPLSFTYISGALAKSQEQPTDTPTRGVVHEVRS